MKNIKICIFLLFVFTLIAGFSVKSFADNSSYIWSSSVETSSEETNSESNSNSLNLESPSAILIEQSTGQILYSHNAHEKLRPASVTKVMSILLIMEALDDRKNFVNR